MSEIDEELIGDESFEEYNIIADDLGSHKYAKQNARSESMSVSDTNSFVGNLEQGQLIINNSAYELFDEESASE